MGEEFGTALRNGTILLQYRLERVLGYGGFGITYLARNQRLDHLVAVKEYFPQTFAVREPDGTVRPKSKLDEEKFQWGRDRFLVEAKVQAGVRHPSIVRVFDFFESRRTAYMVLEYEDGDLLSAYLKRVEKPTEAELLDIVLPILSGLEVLHGAGFIHRDIKPGNIIVRNDGSPVLLDFGAARQSTGEVSHTLTAIVTPGYAPFEQYYSSGKRQGPWTDIYAMGAVLYFAITGMAPRHATERSGALLERKPDPLTPIAQLADGEYSAAFLDAIDWALQVLETDRPRTVMQWRAAMLGEMPSTLGSKETEPTTKKYGEGEAEPARQQPTEPCPNDAGATATTVIIGDSAETSPPVRSGGWKWIRFGLAASAVVASIVLYRFVANPVPSESGGMTPSSSAVTQDPSTKEQPPPAPVELEPQAQKPQPDAEPDSTLASILIRDSSSLGPRPKRVEQRELAQSPPPETVTRDAMQPTAAENDRLRLARLLAQAERDIQERRLTGPKGANAFERYRAALRIEPGNQAARDGIAAVIKLKILLVSTAMKKRNFDQAEANVNHLLALMPGNRKLLDLRSRIRQSRGGR